MTQPENKTGLRILVAGSGRLGLAVLIPLLDSHHQVVGLVQNGRKASRLNRALLPWHYRLIPSIASPVREAVFSNIPIIWLDRLDASELAALSTLEPDILITCGFSIILPPAVLDLPKIGCINVHTSLLPNHRGANPCAYVILNADETSGVTIHVTEEGIDTGAILAQESFPVGSEDTSMDVYQASCTVAEDMILDAIDAIEQNGFAHGVVQSPDAGSYDPRFTDDTVKIDWNRPAVEVDRLIRAAMAYGPAWFEYRRQKIRVANSYFSSVPAKEKPGVIIRMLPDLEIATASGSVTILYAYSNRLGGTRWPGAFAGLKPGMQLK